MSENTETQKKPHRFLKFFGFVVVVILGVAIYSSNGGDDDPTTMSESSPTNHTQAQEADAGSGAPGIGDEAVDGDFTFVVASVEDGPDQIGDDMIGVTPQGKFVLVEMTVSNNGDSAGSFFGDNQFLIDTDGRKASADSEAAVYIEDSQSLFEEINPGNSVTGTVVFDVPADAEPASLELHDSMFSGGVTVEVSQ